MMHFRGCSRTLENNFLAVTSGIWPRRPCVNGCIGRVGLYDRSFMVSSSLILDTVYDFHVFPTYRLRLLITVVHRLPVEY